MLDELVLKNVKATTVGLGLVKKDSAEPFIIFGSGFLVDPNGYVMTAGHVSDKIRELMEICKAKKVEVERTIFMLDPHDDCVDFVTAVLDERISRFHQSQRPTGSTMPDDIDIAVARLLKRYMTCPISKLENQTSHYTKR